MRSKPQPAVLAVTVATLFSISFGAQQKEDERTQEIPPVSNPYLFLIRDPVVHSELRLAEKQKTAITRLTDELDGPLWLLRDVSPEKGGGKLQKLIATAESKLKVILNVRQQIRLNQILLRVQGPAAFRRPDIARKLNLTRNQRQNIQTTAEESHRAIAELKKQLSDGKPREPLEKEAAQLRTQEQEKIQDTLTESQLKRWIAMRGEEIDVSNVGRVAVKAPELMESNDWVNSGPLKLRDLRGQVIALHFLTYG